jgi:riboflavin synthase
MASLGKGAIVNLEMPVRVGDSIGGHILQGHVDAVGVVVMITEKTGSCMMQVEFPERLLRYVIPKGSIAIDGISLTVASISENRVTIAIIPHTMKNTTLQNAQPGTRVNIECDLIGKYLERLVGPHMTPGTSGVIDREKLRSWGYEEKE